MSGQGGSMECMWARHGNALVPVDVVTQELLEELPEGKYFFTSPPAARRNPKFHRWMMTLLHRVCEATGEWVDVGGLMQTLKTESKMFRVIGRVKGAWIVTLDSVSFASMDEVRFKRVANRWIHLITTQIMPGVDPDDLVRGIDEETGYTLH